MTLSERIDSKFAPVVDVMGDFLFWDPFAASGLYDPQVYDDKEYP
ncbi:MAG: hypothetical protein R2764_15310 [Bacteroidales bacterium]